MKKYVFLFLLVSGSIFAQKDNFSFELQGNTYSGLGNNFISEGLGTFTGFGAGITGIIYKNFGLGFEFHKGFTEVKDVSVFGDLRNPQLTTFEILALYRYHATEKFQIEGNIGIANMQIKSKSDYRTDGFSEGGTAFVLGAKGLYSITKNNSLYVLGSPRLYFLSTGTTIDNPEADKYYSKPTLLNFTLGLRLYF